MSLASALSARLESASGPSAAPAVGLDVPPRTARLLYASAAVLIAGGLATWAVGAGVVGFWLFAAAACVLAFALPLPYALASPLWMGFAGWLVDMVPLIVLLGWGAVVLRWGIGLVLARRLPRGGLFILVPVALLAWTVVGVLAISRADVPHFVLLVLIQAVASGAVLAVVDALGDFEARRDLAAALCGFVVATTVVVVLQWGGVPVQNLQDTTVRNELSALDTFPNNVGLIKWARSSRAGAGELRARLDRFARDHHSLPPFQVFEPKFQAFGNQLIVRFEGSAAPFRRELARRGVTLAFDNVGLAPANTLPRMRSIARNALTYAGVCAALFPFALFLAWTGNGRRRALGWAAAASCLFGAAFSLSRGAWAAIVIGVAYLVVDGVLSKGRKVAAIVACAAAAAFITAFFYIDYGVNPLTGRAGEGASTSTRANLYRDTLSFLNPKTLAIGYGTERPRTASGATHVGLRYVPQAGTHSTYLNYLFRLGVPGLLLIALLYLVAWLHARAGARERDGPEAVLCTCAAAAVVAVAAHGVVLNLFVEPIYTLTGSLIVGLALAGLVARLDRRVWPFWARAEGSV